MDSPVYSEEASGSTIELKLNDGFEVSLPESGMGGYRWKIVDSGAPILKNEALSTGASDPSTPGARGSRSWRFTAQQPGSTQLRLQHLRSWQPDAPSREFRLNVKVAA